MSVVLNSTAGVLLEDIFKGCFKGKPSEACASLIVKGSILLLGCLTMLLLMIVDKLGGILVLATSLSSIAAGTTFGLFTLGMLNPYANNKGAIFGAFMGTSQAFVTCLYMKTKMTNCLPLGMIVSGWISFGMQAAVASGTIVPHRLGVSIDECPTSNGTTTPIGVSSPVYEDESNVFPLYRLSFHWINPIGIATVLIVGSIISYITGPRDLTKIDAELISPVIHRHVDSTILDGDRI